MYLLPKQPSTKGPAEMFTGDVYFDVIAKGEEPSRLRVNPRLRGESTGRRALNP